LTDPSPPSPPPNKSTASSSSSKPLPIERFDTLFAAARAENEEAIRIARARADRVKAYLDAGDLDGLREFVEREKDE